MMHDRTSAEVEGDKEKLSHRRSMTAIRETQLAGRSRACEMQMFLPCLSSAVRVLYLVGARALEEEAGTVRSGNTPPPVQ